MATSDHSGSTKPVHGSRYNELLVQSLVWAPSDVKVDALAKAIGLAVWCTASAPCEVPVPSAAHLRTLTKYNTFGG